MKKIVLITCLAISLIILSGTQAKSQLADGTTAPDWELYDINNTPYHLYNYLNAGKTVVIEFFATWCGNCWPYHTSGALQAFYAQHGPSGDNTVMVFFVESDQGSLACIQGSGSSCGNTGGPTQGNWTTGTPYPIIPTYSPNTAGISNAYSVSHVPISYMICAGDKKTRQVTDYTTAQLNTALSSNCNVAPVANFIALSTTSCTGVIQFSDQSSNFPTSWLWTFGDGQTASVKNPSHTYATPGTYSVTLKSFNAYGNNTVTKSSYVTYNMPAAPVTTDGYGTVGSAVTLQATGSGTLNWYSTSTGGTSIYTGNTYVTPSLSTTTHYYVESVISTPVQSAGMSAKTTTGAYYTSTARQGLYFNALVPLTIKTVKVYSDVSGNKTVWLKNNSGVVIDSLVSNISSGEQTVTLNFNIPAGIDYQLGASAACHLWRDGGGATYPYNVSNLISITKNTASSLGAAAYYYYFYNWQVQADPCYSSRSEVTANISTGINEKNSNVNYNVYPNPLSDIINIQFSLKQPENVSFEVYNLLGEKVLGVNNNTYAQGNHNVKISSENMSQGIFYLNILTDDQKYTQKLIIVK